MYNNIGYEDYMRRVLGYNSNRNNVFEPDNLYEANDNMFYRNNDLESLYPEIYRRVYPLVCSECDRNTMPITEECIENMVDNVYKNIQIDLKIETNVNVDVKNTSRQTENRPPRRDDRFLRDLIRILILQELLRRRRPPRRPNFPRMSYSPYGEIQ